MKNEREKVPEILLLAQSLQKGRDYSSSRKLYFEFFTKHPEHHLRFKALFEVADNWFHEKNYVRALNAFDEFIVYCNNQQELTDEERNWVKSYCQLGESRINQIKKSKAEFS